MWPWYGSDDIKDVPGPRELQGLGDCWVLFALEGGPALAIFFQVFPLVIFLCPALFPSGPWGRGFYWPGTFPSGPVPLTRKAATFHIWAFCSHVDPQI